jgi:hypothetical protein
MKQVTFQRTQSNLLRRNMRRCVSAVAASTNANAYRRLHRWAARGFWQESGTSIVYCSVLGGYELAQIWSWHSRTRMPIPLFHARFLECRDADIRCHVTLRLHLVVETLHVCNAKNIFVGRTRCVPVVCIHSACNVTKRAPKFPKNAAVSDAIDTSIDCMMQNENLITDSPYRHARANAKSRSHGPVLCDPVRVTASLVWPDHADARPLFSVLTPTLGSPRPRTGDAR